MADLNASEDINVAEPTEDLTLAEGLARFRRGFGETAPRGLAAEVAVPQEPVVVHSAAPARMTEAEKNIEAVRAFREGRQWVDPDAEPVAPAAPAISQGYVIAEGDAPSFEELQAHIRNIHAPDAPAIAPVVFEAEAIPVEITPLAEEAVVASVEIEAEPVVYSHPLIGDFTQSQYDSFVTITPDAVQVIDVQPEPELSAEELAQEEVAQEEIAPVEKAKIDIKALLGLETPQAILGAHVSASGEKADAALSEAFQKLRADDSVGMLKLLIARGLMDDPELQKLYRQLSLYKVFTGTPEEIVAKQEKDGAKIDKTQEALEQRLENLTNEELNQIIMNGAKALDRQTFKRGQHNADVEMLSEFNDALLDLQDRLKEKGAEKDMEELQRLHAAYRAAMAPIPEEPEPEPEQDEQPAPVTPLLEQPSEKKPEEDGKPNGAVIAWKALKIGAVTSLSILCAGAFIGGAFPIVGAWIGLATLGGFFFAMNKSPEFNNQFRTAVRQGWRKNIVDVLIKEPFKLSKKGPANELDPNNPNPNPDPDAKKGGLNTGIDAIDNNLSDVNWKKVGVMAAVLPVVAIPLAALVGITLPVIIPLAVFGIGAFAISRDKTYSDESLRTELKKAANSASKWRNTPSAEEHKVKWENAPASAQKFALRAEPQGGQAPQPMTPAPMPEVASKKPEDMTPRECVQAVKNAANMNDVPDMVKQKALDAIMTNDKSIASIRAPYIQTVAIKLLTDRIGNNLPVPDKLSGVANGSITLATSKPEEPVAETPVEKPAEPLFPDLVFPGDPEPQGEPAAEAKAKASPAAMDLLAGLPSFSDAPPYAPSEPAQAERRAVVVDVLAGWPARVPAASDAFAVSSPAGADVAGDDAAPRMASVQPSSGRTTGFSVEDLSQIPVTYGRDPRFSGPDGEMDVKVTFKGYNLPWMPRNHLKK